jgi:uridylate kinase
VAGLYRRILLKLSGEVFSEKEREDELIQALSDLFHQGIEMGIVIGGGNILRGKNASLERVYADQMGMLATIINGIYLREKLIKKGCKARVLSSVACNEFVERFSQEKALDSLEKKEIVIFVGGMAHPYFTTDTVAALRAVEIKAEILFKVTKVDGVYDKDPVKFPQAKKKEKMSYTEVLEKDIMDATAVALCRENKLPIRVFAMSSDSVKRAIKKEHVGTLIS